jgi:hypothetical protein
MMTRELLLTQMQISEAREAETYKALTLDLFREIQEPLKLLYDQTVIVSNHFASITPAILRNTPAIIKTLRYCLAPVISQMRLGQLIGLGTTESFEEKGVIPTCEQAKGLALWFNDHLDRDRFQWLSRPHMSAAERRIAEIYAKLWTVSLQSNQNTATKYRNQRKDRQENAIATALQDMGLKFQIKLGVPPQPRKRRKPGDPPHPKLPRRPGGIQSVDDVHPGHYVKEKKILGGSQKKQKSDVTARPSKEPMLFCIEAKAVGIKLDSTKRLKELNDKYTDWMGSGLPITPVGVVAGMFSDTELVATIKRRRIPIFFEHDLGELVAFLKHGLYFGGPWDPDALFPEVTETELEDASKQIDNAPEDEAHSESLDADSDEAG